VLNFHGLSSAARAVVAVEAAATCIRHTGCILFIAALRHWFYAPVFTIRDIKAHDIDLPSGARAGGLPVHDLKLRVTIDRDMQVVDAEAVSDAVPYPGFCDTIAPAYKKLIGLSLLKHFRLHLKDRLSGVLGCTHLTELAQVLPTAAIQAFADDAMASRTEGDASVRPYELDRCHALRLDGPAVEQYYPRWVLKAVPG
jgi:hypothetical protein